MNGSHYATALGSELRERAGARDRRPPRPARRRCCTGVEYYVGLLATTILFIATNAGLIGISRLSWSLAEHRQLPAIFSRLHTRYRTPWFTIVFFSGFAVLLITFASINVLGNLYSFGAMLSFTIAHAAVVALRIKDPDRERPYRMPRQRAHRAARRSRSRR